MKSDQFNPAIIVEIHERLRRLEDQAKKAQARLKKLEAALDIEIIVEKVMERALQEISRRLK